VVRVLGYRSGGPGSIPGTTRKKEVVGLKRGPLSLVSINEELLDRLEGLRKTRNKSVKIASDPTGVRITTNVNIFQKHYRLSQFYLSPIISLMLFGLNLSDVDIGRYNNYDCLKSVTALACQIPCF
jgi:hypothetical protein